MTFSHPSTLAERPYTRRMAKKSKLKLMPVDFDKETLGQRLARIRKERGLTQKDIAERTGLIQTLVSDYERGRLRLAADMIVRFAWPWRSARMNCFNRNAARLDHHGRPAGKCCAASSRSKACPPINNVLC